MEISDQRVAVCRDHVKGACKRQQCKYYHIPIVLPPANVMATISKNDTTIITTSEIESTTNTTTTTTPPVSNQN